MTITSALLTPIATADTNTSAKDLRADDTGGVANAFAQLFAGLIGVKAPVQAAKPEGLSELDAPETQDGTEDGTATSETTESANVLGVVKGAAAATDASGVIRSLVAMDPALQEKLTRVVQRMHDETGHDVQITETFRTQSRQDQLFAQGRETPGEVVTWTRSSKHTQGRAVDVTIDGGKAGFDAYATLQRIATEEGLRTLGARDPGHLELPGTATGISRVPTTFTPAAPADASGPGAVSIARVAQLAQVAKVETVTVARPANVARIATVASVGVNATAAPQAQAVAMEAAAPRQAAQDKPGNVARVVGKVETAQTPNAQGAPVAHAAASNGTRTGQQSSGQRGKSDDSSSSDTPYATLDLRAGEARPFNINATAAPTSVGAAERTQRVIDAFDAAPARPLSQITMSIDAGNGQTDRIQVATRGNAVSATIDARDAGGAQQMISRTDDLVRALNREGLDVDQLTIRAAGAAPLTATNAGQTSDSSSNSRFDRGNPWQQDGDQRQQRGEQGNRGRQQQQQQQQQQRDEREENSK